MEPPQVKTRLRNPRKLKVRRQVSPESEAIAAAVFALDNSGPVSSEFTQPIVPGEPQQSAEPLAIYGSSLGSQGDFH